MTLALKSVVSSRFILVAAILLAIVIGLFIFGQGEALAVGKDSACDGIKAAGGSCDSGDAEGAIGGIVEQVVRILTIIVGALSVVMIIWGGFRYIISGGDSNAAAAAKKTIIYALVGLTIVILANVIISVVVTTASDAASNGGGGQENSQEQQAEPQ